MKKRLAFSTLEILLTVFIFACVFAFSLLYTQLGTLRTDLKTQASILETHLREAQNNASSGKESGAFGVHLNAGSYVLFEGTGYDPLASTNFEVLLPEVLSIGSVSLQGAGSDLIFDAPLGTTEEYGTFVLTSSRTDQTLLFTITPLGHVSYE